MVLGLTLPAFKGSTVEVSILHGGRITLSAAHVIHNPIPGHDVYDIPCYSFLIENKKLDKRVLYDLGIMKDWKQKQPPKSVYSRPQGIFRHDGHC